MILIFNLPALAIVFISFWFAMSIFRILEIIPSISNLTSGSIIVLSFGLGIVSTDLIYRLKFSKGQGNKIMSPSNGGSIFWIPCWAYGALLTMILLLMLIINAFL